MEFEPIGFEKSPFEKLLRRLWEHRRRIISLLVTIAFALSIAYRSWDPYQRTNQRFDAGENGLFVSSEWLSGKLFCDEEDENCQRMRETQLAEMVELVGGLGLRYIFVLASAVMSDGGLEYEKGAFFETFKNRLPEGARLIAWTPCYDCRQYLSLPEWRRGLADSLQPLADDGFDGIILEVKDLKDSREHYPLLLEELQKAAPYEFIVGQMIGAVDRGEKIPGSVKFLSYDDEFLAETIGAADLTVFALYSTAIPLQKIYIEYVKRLTTRMITVGCAKPGRKLMGAVLASGYANPPMSSNSVESIANGIRATRAGLENFPRRPECFAGLAIYAKYTAAPLDWDVFRYYWQTPDETE